MLKHTIGLRGLVLGTVIGISAIAAVTAISTSATAAGQAIAVPADNLNWKPCGWLPFGSQFVGLGEHAMLLKFPAGYTTGPHSHGADYHGVSLQGNWVHTFGDDDARPLPPGSYVMQPGEELHNELCAGPEECIIFFHRHAPIDFIPPESAGNL